MENTEQGNKKLNEIMDIIDKLFAEKKCTNVEVIWMLERLKLDAMGVQ